MEWIKFNYNQVGYYRVNYPTAMWENLANKLVEDPKVSYCPIDLMIESDYRIVADIFYRR